MKNRLILIILILFLTGCERKPLLDKLSGSKVTETITITEWGKWIPTHIVVKRDQTFTVTASGKISIGTRNYFPDGLAYDFTNGYSGYLYWGILVGNAPLGKLYGQVNNLNLPLGSDFNGTSPADGILYLGIIDYNWPGLSITGSYTVTITVE